MQTELEAKFLDIHPHQLRQRLRNLGAQLIAPERLMRRHVFDFPDRRLHSIGGWVRVRDEGDKITASYKQLNNRSLHGTQEINIQVNSFDDTRHFLEAIGLIQKSYQETRRESWKLDATEIEIDTWPWIPSFVELESRTEDELKATAARLDLPWAAALHGSVETAYQRYFDVTEAEIDSWPDIRFVPTPPWLEAKRKPNALTGAAA